MATVVSNSFGRAAPDEFRGSVDANYPAGQSPLPVRCAQRSRRADRANRRSPLTANCLLLTASC